MGLLKNLFHRPYAPQNKQEVSDLIAELLTIGEREDYLSERPGTPYNSQCRHLRARAIGKRLDELGGFELMEFVNLRVKKKLGQRLASHLEYAWRDNGTWMY